VATYWVSDLQGVDDVGHTGLSYVLAKKTCNEGLKLLASAGDILNIVNDGEYALEPVAANAPYLVSVTGGSSWENFGFKIQGTTPTGTPALTTLKSGNTAAFFIKINAAYSYTIVQGFRFDSSAARGNAAVSQTYVWIDTSLSSTTWGPIKIRWCEVDAGVPTATLSSRNLLHYHMSNSIAGITNIGSVEYCYIRNVGLSVISIQPHDDYNGSPANFEVKNCFFYDTVGYTSSTSRKILLDDRIGSVGSTSSVHHNTWVCSGTVAFPYQTAFVQLQSSFNASTLWATNVLLHSNIFAFYGVGANPNTSSTFRGMGFFAQLITNPTIGYNIFKYEGTARIPTSGWYSGIVDPDRVDAPDDADTYATDHVLHSGVTDHSDLFHIPGTPRVWAEPLADGGYTITIPGDLRPRYLYRTDGLDASIPGATAETFDEAPITVDDAYACLANETVSGNVLTNDSDPDGYPTVGEVQVPMTAVWYSGPTAGTLVGGLGSDGSFTYLAPADDGVYTFTYRAYDSELFSRVTTVTITVTSVVVPPDPPPDDVIEDPVFLDVLPWFEPDLKVVETLSIQTKRNRVIHHDQRSYSERKRWREFTHRVVELATNTTQIITLGGIQTAEFVMLKTDSPIDMAINGNFLTEVGQAASPYWPVTSLAALSMSCVTGICLRNNSTTNTATIIMAVTD